MSASHRAVKLDGSLVADADQAARPSGRSLGGQIEHWARLGQAAENAHPVPHTKIRASASERTIDELGEAETHAFLRQLGTAMQNPTEAEKAFYASLPDDAPGISEEELFGPPRDRL